MANSTSTNTGNGAGTRPGGSTTGAGHGTTRPGKTR